jgi:hypothetical protein
MIRAVRGRRISFVFVFQEVHISPAGLVEEKALVCAFNDFENCTHDNQQIPLKAKAERRTAELEAKRRIAIEDMANYVWHKQKISLAWCPRDLRERKRDS